MCHPSEPTLKKFFKDTVDDDEETQRVIEEVCRSCMVCLRHKKTPPKPKAGLPVSQDFNKVVSLDLKVNQMEWSCLYSLIRGACNSLKDIEVKN